MIYIDGYIKLCYNVLNTLKGAFSDPIHVKEFIIMKRKLLSILLALAMLASACALIASCEFGENVTVVSAIEKERTEELSALVAEISFGKGQFRLLGIEERATKENFAE